MKEKKLGRGLSAFFEEGNAELLTNRTGELFISDTSGISNRVIEIDSNLIDENPHQPRKIFNQENLEELSRSISAHGIIQPLFVQEKENGRYTLIAGERRLRASKLAKIEKVPCIVSKEQYNSEKLLELALLENIQRDDIDVVEEAEAYKKLMEQFRYTQDRVSEVAGKSRSHIANILRMNNLPNSIKELVHSKAISFGHARALLGTDDADSLAQKVIKDGLSVRQIEQYIKNRKQKNQKGSEQENSSKSNDVEELEYHLSQLLDLKVKAKLKNNKGSIEIYFNNSNELDKFMQKIN